MKLGKLQLCILTVLAPHLALAGAPKLQCGVIERFNGERKDTLLVELLDETQNAGIEFTDQIGTGISGSVRATETGSIFVHARDSVSGLTVDTNSSGGSVSFGEPGQREVTLNCFLTTLD